MDIFWKEGLSYANYNTSKSEYVGYTKFRSFYGVPPNVCAILWNLIENKPQGSKPKHLLWCLHFLKCYKSERVNAATMKVDEQTFRNWVWKFVDLLSDLNVVIICNATIY
jgi:hypothetical protein